MPKAFKPEMMWNYSPVIRPQPPLALDDVCGDNPVCVSFDCEFIPYLLGLLEIYRWPDRFQGTEAEQEYSAGLFRDLMEVLAMACCCDGSSSVTQVIEHQITVYGELQITIDGGETWTQDPQDPRVAVPALPPYVTSTNGLNKCDAVSNALDNLKDVQADCAIKLETGLTALELAYALLVSIASAVFFGGEVPALVGIIYALTSAIKNMTVEAYNAMFTEEAWNDVLCAMYCNIGDNGQFNESQFHALMGDLEEKLPGGDDAFQVSANMRSFFRVWGVKGLNNACAIGAQATADCSDCACGCDLTNWSIPYPGYAVLIGTGVDEFGFSYVDLEAVLVPSEYGGYGVVWASDGNETCCTIQNVETLSGAGAGNWIYCLCGEDLPAPDVSWPHSGLLPNTDVPIRGIGAAAPGAFSIRITFGG